MIRGLVNAGALEPVQVTADKPLACPDPDHGEPDELEKILGRTLGVPIFQDQAMKIALDAARFSPAEANRLRRAMARLEEVAGEVKGER